MWTRGTWASAKGSRSRRANPSDSLGPPVRMSLAMRHPRRRVARTALLAALLRATLLHTPVGVARLANPAGNSVSLISVPE